MKIFTAFSKAHMDPPIWVLSFLSDPRTHVSRPEAANVGPLLLPGLIVTFGTLSEPRAKKTQAKYHNDGHSCTHQRESSTEKIVQPAISQHWYCHFLLPPKTFKTFESGNGPFLPCCFCNLGRNLGIQCLLRAMDPASSASPSMDASKIQPLPRLPSVANAEGQSPQGPSTTIGHS